MKKLFMPVVVVVTLVAMLVPAAVFAAETGTATGTFSNNNVPSITYVKLYDTGGTPAEVSAMTPQTAYAAWVLVTDADLKADLTTIVVKIYYDSTTEGTTEAEYDGKSAATQTCAIITWTESSGVFALTAMAGTTWALGTCVEPTTLADPFKFLFTVGKVATEATGGAADDWQIAAKVTDDSAQTAWAADSNGSTMNWYGEISGVSGTVSWGLVNPGMDFAEGDPSEEALGVTIKYISNGAFDEKVKSGDWAGVPSGTATLATDGIPDAANEFALKADDTGTLTSAVVVDATGVAIDDTGALTEEAGHDAAANALWLKLNATFTKAVYTGTITYIIADGS
jgi:hypothetical protein